MNKAELKTCPCCGALPIDWVDNPFKAPASAGVLVEALTNLLSALSPLTVLGNPISSLDSTLARRITEAVQALSATATPASDGVTMERCARVCDDLAATARRSMRQPADPLAGGIVDGMYERAAGAYENAAAAIRGINRSADKRDDHRGWQIDHSPPPIPCRDFDFVATHPDFDGAPDANDSRQVFSRTINGVVAEIDAWYEEHDA